MKIAELIELVKTLRRKCPWDRTQNLKSLRNNVVEEAYELVEAIDKDDLRAIEEEIGDILFLGIFVAIVFEQEKGVRFDSLLRSTITKYRSKHPHVFKRAKLTDPDAVLRFWTKKKKDAFSGIPKTLPALFAARLIQERAARVGFDWETPDGPLKKVDEEIRELKRCRSARQRFEEFGDLVFACVNLARHLKLDAEEALRHANQKFVKRFRKVEAALKRKGRAIEDATLEEMDRVWDEIKR
jgi:tetrapyrrole methylase family protein/MazG family protein